MRRRRLTMRQRLHRSLQPPLRLPGCYLQPPPQLNLMH